VRWHWIDRVISLEPGRRLVAVKCVSASEEHLRDHFPGEPVMPASLVIEGMAQTAGILVGHAGGFREKVVLAKIPRAEISCDATPGTTLRYTATIEQMSPQGASTRGVVELLDPAEPGAGFAPAGRIDIIFSHLDRSAAGMECPAENFVFGAGFRSLLRGVERA
jgi:3-hydroxyacyl-[acyl-carrier-protein] dehydratase